MVRPYAAKGKKRKTREEKYDRDEEELAEQVGEPSNKAEEEADEEEADEEEEHPFQLEGIPIDPAKPNPKDQPGVIFILEKACLEIGKVGKTEQLLNSDDHANFLKKKGKNPAHYRPDILHQALLMVLDSPVNKAGRLKCVYVKTEDGKLIEIKPFVRIPRTFKRFSGVMLQLLQKLSISAVGKREKLMRMVKNPVTQYLPINSRKVGLSYSSEKLVSIQNYVAAAESTTDLVFVVGAMAHGKVETDYTEDFVSICSYPLSAAYCITMICQALAGKWNILLKTDAGALDNFFEVIGLLKSRGASTNDIARLAKIKKSEYKVLDYLVHTPVGTHTRKGVEEFKEKCRQYKFGNDKIINIINTRPATVVELYPILPENDGELEEVVALVADVLAPPTASSPQPEAGNDDIDA